MYLSLRIWMQICISMAHEVNDAQDVLSRGERVK